MVAKRRKKRKEGKLLLAKQAAGARRRLDWIWIVEQKQLTETCSIYLFFFSLTVVSGWAVFVISAYECVRFRTRWVFFRVFGI